MKSYLSGRGSNSDALTKSDSECEFSSYLDSHQKVDSSLSSEAEADNNENVLTEQIHQDESGIKVEVVTDGGKPKKIMIHIPDGRIIELGCEY